MMRRTLLTLLLTGGCVHATGPDAESAPNSVVALTATQAAQINTALAKPLVVRVLNTSFHSMPNITVVWTVETDGGSVSPVTSITNNQGLASTTWTVGTTPGTYRVRATTAELQGKSEAVFIANVLPASAQAADSSGAAVRLADPGIRR